MKALLSGQIDTAIIEPRRLVAFEFLVLLRPLRPERLHHLGHDRIRQIWRLQHRVRDRRLFGLRRRPALHIGMADFARCPLFCCTSIDCSSGRP